MLQISTGPVDQMFCCPLQTVAQWAPSCETFRLDQERLAPFRKFANDDAGDRRESDYFVGARVDHLLPSAVKSTANGSNVEENLPPPHPPKSLFRPKLPRWFASMKRPTVSLFGRRAIWGGVFIVARNSHRTRAPVTASGFPSLRPRPISKAYWVLAGAMARMRPSPGMLLR